MSLISEFKIEELEDRFVLGPINSHDCLYEAELCKKLLDEGELHSHMEWTRLLKHSEWSLPSGPFYFGIFKALHQNRNGKYKQKIEKIRQKLGIDFWDCSMATSTLINYFSGLGEVINDYGMINQYSKTILIKNGNLRFTVESLIGADSIVNAKKIIEWACGMDLSLGELENRLPLEGSRILTFGRDIDNYFEIRTEAFPSSRLTNRESEYLKRELGVTGFTLDDYFDLLILKYNNNLSKFCDDNVDDIMRKNYQNPGRYPEIVSLETFYGNDLSSYLNSVKGMLEESDYCNYALSAHGIIKRRIL